MQQKKQRTAKYHDFPLNKNLRDLVSAKNIAEFSEKMGISQDAVRQWQSGYTRPDVDRLSAIAKYFGVTTDYLLGLEGHKSHENEAIGRTTLLSDKAINKLSEVVRNKTTYRNGLLSHGYERPSQLKELSGIIESEYFIKLINEIGKLQDYEKLYAVDIIGFEETHEFCRNLCLKTFGDILFELSPVKNIEKKYLKADNSSIVYRPPDSFTDKEISDMSEKDRNYVIGKRMFFRKNGENDAKKE